MIPKHYRIHLVLMVSVLFMFLYPMIVEKPDREKENLATESATRFLGLIDTGEYGKSWDEGASLLQQKIARDVWATQLARSRELTGKVVSREKSKAVYSTVAYESPDGQYIVITYKTQFQKQKLTETVTVMLDGDARWKVAGYFVQ